MTQEFWETHYRDHGEGSHAQPTPQLVAAVGDLAPGTALDAGCGTGADAVWLTTHGWDVTAVDISGTALDRARERAGEVSSRITWVQADLTQWTHPAQFDLVTSPYVHPAAPRDVLFARLATAVAPGGTLLLLDHHTPTLDLSPDHWDIGVGESVLQARRRA